MEGFTGIDASSRKKKSLICTSFPAGCFRTQSALDHQGLNHVIDLTTPSPSCPLRTSQLNIHQISKPFEDTRTTSPTLNRSRYSEDSYSLPYCSSRDVKNVNQYAKRRDECDSIFLSTLRSFSGSSEQLLEHKTTDEYSNHQMSKEKHESQYSRY
ncbi:uncharacterized protein EAF01_001262 [Botrytis porri]|uniref:uncharacterized protein n=1 Tax=Botrytis porri TaxID=87229 RepID=UPI0019018556|nr:uncharacterized protein EAF01_001262 [Botrytis porri]KAF7912241.1 hypothetical protein EAF01_001262 [Botrytis porri]